MKITEKDVTGPIARQLRESLSLKQPQFWNPVGVQQSVGSRYEREANIPHSVRILLVATYVAGLKLDTNTPEAVEALTRLAAVQTSFKSASAHAAAARADLNNASKNISTAQALLGKV